MPRLVAAAEHAGEHAERSACGGQQKQRFFRNTARPAARRAFIVAADGKRCKVDGKKIENKTDR